MIAIANLTMVIPGDDPAFGGVAREALLHSLATAQEQRVQLFAVGVQKVLYVIFGKVYGFQRYGNEV